ncbi:MAG: hypothetical protein JWM33_822 [Caulobacteraceae bacterium]|nr:hypothetical protein [Caulobacteraceae bacterium]
MNRPVRPLASLLSAMVFLAVLGGVSSAQAASPAKPDPYATGVQDEVMVQNLTCEDIEVFLEMPLGYKLIIPATQVLNQPQHANETSDTLFGQTLTRLILAASRYPAADHPPSQPPGPPPNSLGPPGQAGIPQPSRTGVASQAAAPTPVLEASTGCTRIVPRSAPPDSAACDGRTYIPPPMPGIDLQDHPGELKLLGLFDHAAKYKNCRR